MTTTLQHKLRGIFLTDNSPENLTNPAGDIFSKVISAVTNFFQYLISLFNQKFPPEKREEQIHWLLDGATPYIIGAVFLITWLCCCSCLLSCVSCSLRGCYNLCCGTRSAAKMMKAPGRPSMKIPRSAFEENPSGYFRSLRDEEDASRIVPFWIQFDKPVTSKEIRG